MTNFFYFDQSGQKQGPVNDNQLKALAAQGIINPQTQLETDSGHKGQAGQIPGLFTTPAPVSPFTATVPQSVSVSATNNISKPVIFGGIGVLLLLLIAGTWWILGESPNKKAINAFCQEFGSDIKAVDREGRTLLHKAALMGNLPVVQFLIKKGSDVNAKDRQGLTPLHEAAFGLGGNNMALKNYAPFQMAEFAGKVAQDADDDDEATPSISKVYDSASGVNKSNKLAVVKLLIKSGADVNAKSHDGISPLDIAAGEGRLEIVKLLVANGATFSDLIINHARNEGHTEVAEFLAGMQKQPQPAAATTTKRSPVASKKQSAENKTKIAEIDKIYTENNGNVNASLDEYGKTLLHKEAMHGNIETAKHLVSKGANVNAKTKNGSTPLHFAAMEANDDVATYLVSQGADVNAKNEREDTPLHNAAAHGSIEGVKYLVSKGANVNAQNKDGGTPLLGAASNKNVEVAKFLVSEGANVHVKTTNGFTPLHLVDNVEIAKFFVSQGADVNAKASNVHDNTPLHFAVSNGKVDVVKFLVSQGADPHAKTSYGETPLDLAKKSNNTAIIDCFSGNK